MVNKKIEIIEILVNEQFNNRCEDIYVNVSLDIVNSEDFRLKMSCIWFCISIEQDDFNVTTECGLDITDLDFINEVVKNLDYIKGIITNDDVIKL